MQRQQRRLNGFELEVQFLSQLTPCCICKTLAALQLAAGEFPQSTPGRSARITSLSPRRKLSICARPAYVHLALGGPVGALAADHDVAVKGMQKADEDDWCGLTWRLHPSITAFTSEVFYDGKLQSRDGLEVQSVAGKAGLQLVAVTNAGNSNESKRPKRLGNSLSSCWPRS